MSCYSFYTEPPYAHITDGLYLGWMGARCEPRWNAVLSIATKKQTHHVLNSKQCSGRHTGVLREGVPCHLIEHDDQTPGITVHFSKAFDFIDEHLGKGDLYVHCHAAISRSPLAVALYLADRKGWDFEEAYHFIHQQRPVVDIWTPYLNEARAFLHHRRGVKSGALPPDAPYLPPLRSGW